MTLPPRLHFPKQFQQFFKMRTRNWGWIFSLVNRADTGVAIAASVKCFQEVVVFEGLMIETVDLTVCSRQSEM
jgi:hypothetical protein